MGSPRWNRIREKGKAFGYSNNRGIHKRAGIRAKTLGMADHPVVVIEHPIASKTKQEIHETARRSVEKIVLGLRGS